MRPPCCKYTTNKHKQNVHNKNSLEQPSDTGTYIGNKEVQTQQLNHCLLGVQHVPKSTYFSVGIPNSEKSLAC